MKKSRPDQSMSLILSQCRQLGKSLLLLAHFVTLFVIFVARTVEWMVQTVRWTNLCARYTVSAFDSVYRYLHWGKRKSLPGGTKEVCSDMEPQ